MTTTEQNEFLARYMGWEETMTHFLVPSESPNDNPGGFHKIGTNKLLFLKSWNWFQLAFQKWREETKPCKVKGWIRSQILQAFWDNDISEAANLLIIAIQENVFDNGK